MLPVTIIKTIIKNKKAAVQQNREGLGLLYHCVMMHSSMLILEMYTLWLVQVFVLAILIIMRSFFTCFKIDVRVTSLVYIKV